MSQAVEIVRRMYDARGWEDTLRFFHPEVVLDASVRMDSGIARGRDELARTIGEWVDAFDGWREEIDEVRDLGGQVLVVARQMGRAKESGIEMESPYAVLYEVRDGQITKMTMFREEADALAAAGVR